MNTVFFTIASAAYQAQISILAGSLQRHHASDEFVVVRLKHASDSTVWSEPTVNESNFIMVRDIDPLLEKQVSLEYASSIVEAATAVKAAAFAYFMEKGYQKVIYLDPDTVVLSPLVGVTRELGSNSIVLTPHQLTPQDQDWQIRENEIGSLKFGIFNFGCLGVSNTTNGLSFLEWWKNRLIKYCHDDHELGTFTDQKWGNLVPIFFPDSTICCDPGVNVASWNLAERIIRRTDEGEYRVKLKGDVRKQDSSLQLFHFTKAKSIGNFVTARHAGSCVEVAELWRWYLSELSLYE